MKKAGLYLTLKIASFFNAAQKYIIVITQLHLELLAEPHTEPRKSPFKLTFKSTFKTNVVDPDETDFSSTPNPNRCKQNLICPESNKYFLT